jgi:hypothetical protein
MRVYDMGFADIIISGEAGVMGSMVGFWKFW